MHSFAPGSSTKGLSGNFRDFGLKNAIFWGSKTQFRTRIVICHICDPAKNVTQSGIFPLAALYLRMLNRCNSVHLVEGKAKKLDDDKTSISQGSGVVGPLDLVEIPQKLVKKRNIRTGIGNFGLKNAIFGQGNGQIPASKTQIFGQPFGGASRGLDADTSKSRPGSP
ncbi:hypothetical protein B0H14DRAFT_2691634 [Mycena olivaceomarginata]|nr:hypothetical protein B0H14DRAFT_2691634 [Mycena olivaceomarginata]